MNRHIWCIEICGSYKSVGGRILLNRHIWCIEIFVLYRPLRSLLLPWTDTYDVLKLPIAKGGTGKSTALEPTHMMYWNSKKPLSENTLSYAWTDTYDVLKLLSVSSFLLCFCTWTDTYDVLKYILIEGVGIVRELEPTHMMYWNHSAILDDQSFYNLNRHIWCIEIKWVDEDLIPGLHLNRHIWCIEITKKKKNRNATSILEPTHMMYWNWLTHPWILNAPVTWTDTYDVLK